MTRYFDYHPSGSVLVHNDLKLLWMLSFALPIKALLILWLVCYMAALHLLDKVKDISIRCFPAVITVLVYKEGHKTLALSGFVPIAIIRMRHLLCLSSSTSLWHAGKQTFFLWKYQYGTWPSHQRQKKFKRTQQRNHWYGYQLLQILCDKR